MFESREGLAVRPGEYDEETGIVQITVILVVRMVESDSASDSQKFRTKEVYNR